MKIEQEASTGRAVARLWEAMAKSMSLRIAYAAWSESVLVMQTSPKLQLTVTAGYQEWPELPSVPSQPWDRLRRPLSC